MEYVIGFVVVIIAMIAAAISQMKAVGSIEKEKLSPVLDSLYADPNSREKHELFMQGLRAVDEKIRQYKSDNYSYTPDEIITSKLLRHTERYPNDKLAHQRFMEVISRAEQLASDSLFTKLLQQLKANPNSLSHERFAVCVSKARFLSAKLLEPLFDYLDLAPLNSVVQQHFIQCASHIMLLSDTQRERIYLRALEILEDNPSNPAAKRFVLNVGRWHFGKSRKDGRITIYDEQRIQNDILARAV